ncbi:hypothetical protein ACSQ76_02590 [Roseovarius sp. B08]|uniref:hypothetical protein n=1 Tax=Roseovarius sp. B08 TaxID=3449223 RepID=UPI003EDC8A7D
MQDTCELTFSSPGARLQYSLLMALFRLAVSRGLYGRFARGLGRIFNRDNQVFLRIDGAPPFGISLDDGYWTRFALWHEEYEPEVAAGPRPGRRKSSAIAAPTRAIGRCAPPRCSIG